MQIACKEYAKGLHARNEKENKIELEKKKDSK